MVFKTSVYRYDLPGNLKCPSVIAAFSFGLLFCTIYIPIAFGTHHFWQASGCSADYEFGAIITAPDPAAYAVWTIAVSLAAYFFLLPGQYPDFIVPRRSAALWVLRLAALVGIAAAIRFDSCPPRICASASGFSYRGLRQTDVSYRWADIVRVWTAACGAKNEGSLYLTPAAGRDIVLLSGFLFDAKNERFLALLNSLKLPFDNVRQPLNFWTFCAN